MIMIYFNLFPLCAINVDIEVSKMYKCTRTSLYVLLILDDDDFFDGFYNPPPLPPPQKKNRDMFRILIEG